MPLPYIHFSSVTSTNDIAMQYATENKPEGTAIIADYQTKGRGQQGNCWESKATKNMLFSVLFYPHFLAVKHFFLLSEITALAIIDFLALHKIEGKIKWPNDILVEHQKICGILIEQSFTGNNLDHSVIGVGFNLNQEFFGDMAYKATSLSLLTGKKYQPLSEFQQLHQLLFSRYQQLQTQIKKNHITPIITEYMSQLLGFNTLKKYRIVQNNEMIEGEIIDVNTQGLLTLQTKSQVFSFANKEIEFLL